MKLSVSIEGPCVCRGAQIKEQTVYHLMTMTANLMGHGITLLLAQNQDLLMPGVS